MPQPFLIAEKENGERVVLNEAHVSTVSPHERGYAIVRMSNGDELVLAYPPYDDWENDVLVRKD